MGKAELERWKKVVKEIAEDYYPLKLWNIVSSYSINYLEKGRPNFDVPHTKGVVNWVFRLSSDYNLRVNRGEIPNGTPVDKKALITTAWAHDIGYYGEFLNEARLDEVMDRKKRHMIVGADMIFNFLSENATEFLTEKQINSISHLVRVHDNLECIQTIEETIFLEADTLGAIDISWVEPTFRGEEALRFLERERTKKRHSLFKTPLGLESLALQIKSFQRFIHQRDFSEKRD